MSETARIILEGQEYEFPVLTGSENEKAIDISKLRGATGHITLDPGFKNTGLPKVASRILTAKTACCDTVDTALKNWQRRPLLWKWLTS